MSTEGARWAHLAARACVLPGIDSHPLHVSLLSAAAWSGVLVADLARAVAAEIQSQRDQAESEAAWAASEEAPAFNTRTGESNFGKRKISPWKIHFKLLLNVIASAMQ